MTVTTEKNDSVWTIVHDRPETRNAMDPESAQAIWEAMMEFEKSPSARVAVLWGKGANFCAGWDLKFASGLTNRVDFQREIVDHLAFPPEANAAGRGPLGPTRMELSKPTIAAIEGAAVAGGMEGYVVRYASHVRGLLFWSLLSTLGNSANGRWQRAAAPLGGPRSRS